jgi:hypothetical protein
LTVYKELQADIEAYARALNLGFANAILVSLPRNIRDRIYSYLLARPNTKITVCDGKALRHLRCTGNSMEARNSFWKLPDRKHYYDPLYVGKVVAREVAEMHYVTSTFYFDYHELHLVHNFLAVDRFDCGISPSSLVKNIEVVLDASSTCPCNSASLACSGFATAPMSSTDAIKWCLEQFLGLSARPARIKVIVLLGWANSGKQWIHGRFKVLLAIVIAIVLRTRCLGLHTAFTIF